MDSDGFSILEKVFVLTLVGVLAALGAPAFGPMVDGPRAESALDRFVGMANLARIAAVREGERVRLSYETDADGCIGEVRIFVVETARPIRTRDLAGSRACVRSNGHPFIVFNARGMPAGVFSRTVESRSGSRTARATMSSVGRWRRVE